jgi:hypothetical protein
MGMVEIRSCGDEKNETETESGERPSKRLHKRAAVVNVLLQPREKPSPAEPDATDRHWTWGMLKQFVRCDIST